MTNQQNKMDKTIVTVASNPAAGTQHSAAAGTATTTSSPVPSSVVLLGQKSVAIEHQGSIYRLQVTKLGKLILTK